MMNKPFLMDLTAFPDEMNQTSFASTDAPPESRG